MNEKIITTVEQISALRKNAGQSEKRIKNSAQEFISIPESGTFDKVGEKEFDIPGVGIRKSIGLYLVGGGFISENALNAQKLLKELTKVKNGERKDKFILKSSRLSDLSKHGNSADQRLLNLQGKSFTTQKQVDCIVYKSAALEKFDTVVVTTDTPANLEKVLKQTETKDLYKFEIE